MKIPTEQHALHLVSDRLAELLGAQSSEVGLSTKRQDAHVKAVVDGRRVTFVIEWKSSGSAAAVGAAINQLLSYQPVASSGILLVAVPFMGEVGRRMCAEKEIGWLDLCGNARIFATGLRIWIEGQPNRYKRLGRPSSAFAPKSSRIARWLLMNPTRHYAQREIARAVDMDEGYTSRVVGKLEDDGLLVRDHEGGVRARDPQLLLDAWLEDYEFNKHDILKGHVPARSGDAALRELVGQLKQQEIRYAATGLAAAWLLDKFAGFRLVTFYLDRNPTPELLSRLSFREDDRGANVWLVVPNDEGVFQGEETLDGIRCVHPVQAFLDLGAHSERADEAAQKLRAEHLNWQTDA